MHQVSFFNDFTEAHTQLPRLSPAPVRVRSPVYRSHLTESGTRTLTRIEILLFLNRDALSRSPVSARTHGPWRHWTSTLSALTRRKIRQGVKHGELWGAAVAFGRYFALSTVVVGTPIAVARRASVSRDGV